MNATRIEDDYLTARQRHNAQLATIANQKAVSVGMARLIRRTDALEFEIARAINYIDIGDADHAKSVLLKLIRRET